MRRGVAGACKAIDSIVNLVQTTKDTSDESTARDLVRLIEIKEIISKPSTYDTIVACLQPCLTTNRLEDAKHPCLHGQDCSKYGFRWLWSLGLQKTLLVSDEPTTQAVSEVELPAMLDGDEAVIDEPLHEPNAQDKALVNKPGNQEENNTQVEYVNKSLVEDAALSCRE